MPRKTVQRPVKWLSEEIIDKPTLSNSFHYYTKFQFKNIIAEIGQFVLISNADAAEPDTEEGCDAARILELYEDTSNKNDPFRAKVQWYSRPDALPNWCFNKMDAIEFGETEVIEDHRPFDTDVSIETFFKTCSITMTYTKDIMDTKILKPFHYICRYRLMCLSKRKIHIEPVMEEERKALQLLSTPNKVPTTNNTPKTPTSLVKRMSRVTLHEPKSWSVSKNDGTKLLLKRAILADKNDKDSPKKTPKSATKITVTPSETPKSSRKLTRNKIEDILSMELQENSDNDDDLPVLIIRQHVTGTPKRKQSISKTNNDTPKKILIFDDEDKDKNSLHMAQDTTPVKRSTRTSKAHVNYKEEDISPVKRTPRKSVHKSIEADEYSVRVRKSQITHMEKDTFTVKQTLKSKTSKATINYNEEDISPVKRTPRKSICKMDVDNIDDEYFKPYPKTPRTSRTPRASKATPMKTPKRSIAKISTSALTPTLHTRAHLIDNIDDYMKENKSLPGRESQMEEILSFIRNKLLDSTSGCMYISGVPGTGKTATVCSALKLLKEEEDLPDFQLVEVNGMRIAEPRQAYVQIYKQLTGKSVVWEQACSLLEKRFTNPGPRRTPTVLLVDELDALCTRRQDVLYSIMEWASHNTALLTVVAVANTMDLPERALAARVASRLGLTRLTFPPYTHTQLQTIVATRLAGANVTPDAVQLIARKVAAVSGDARRALALCSRALELAGPEGAGLREVQKALGETASSAAVRAIRACSPAETLILRALAAEVERTGTDETTLSRALMTASAIIALDGRPYKSGSIRAPTSAQAQAICARLAAARLVLLEPKPSEPRLLLNVSADDVHYATRQISV